MSDNHNSPEDKQNTFIMEGPVTSSGLSYRVSPQTITKNRLKNAYNTDIARERGIVPESEDWGTIENNEDKK